MRRLILIASRGGAGIKKIEGIHVVGRAEAEFFSACRLSSSVSLQVCVVAFDTDPGAGEQSLS